MNRNIESQLFRLWVRLHPPLRLREMRPLWHEVRRFVREQETAPMC